MALTKQLIVRDRVAETTTTTGTGALTLAAAVPGFQRFNAVMSVGDRAPYSLEAVDSNGVPTGDWEEGWGTYSASNTFTRTRVLASSNGGSAVSLTAGTKRIFIANNSYMMGKPWFWNPPQSGDFAGNAGPAALTIADDDDVGLLLSHTTSNNDATHGPYIALPAWSTLTTNWTATIHFNGFIYNTGYAGLGMAVYNDDFTKNFVLSIDARNYVHFYRQNATSYDGFEQSTNTIVGAADNINWLRWNYTASTGYIECQWSADGKLFLNVPTVIGTRNLLPATTGVTGSGSSEMGTAKGPSWIGPAIVPSNYSNYPIGMSVDYFKVA